MGRPKKELPNRADQRFEIKMIIPIEYGGDGKQKSFYSRKSKEDAKLSGLEYIERLKNNRLKNQYKFQSFSSWADKWLEVYKKGDVKSNSYAFTYKNAVNNHLKPYFKEKNLNDIKASDVKSFFKEKQKTHAYDSCRKMLMCLNGIFETAIDEDLCIKNPARNIKLVRDDPNAISAPDGGYNEKRIYSKQHLDLLIEFAKSHRFGIDFLMLACTGIRRGELLAIITDEDIDTQNDILHIRHAVADVEDEESGKFKAVRGKTKNFSSVRDIPIPHWLSEYIDALPRTIKIGGNKRKNIAPISVPAKFLVYTKFGKQCSPRTWSRRHYETFIIEAIEFYAGKNIEIPQLTPHEIRHTFATHRYAEGMNLLSLAKILGHTDLNMLAQRYGHTDLDKLKKDLGYTEI